MERASDNDVDDMRYIKTTTLMYNVKAKSSLSNLAQLLQYALSNLRCTRCCPALRHLQKQPSASIMKPV